MYQESFIVRELGPLDPLTIARVLAIGATPEEIVEVRERLEANDGLDRVPASSSRVSAVLDIIQPIWDAEDDEASDAMARAG